MRGLLYIGVVIAIGITTMALQEPPKQQEVVFVEVTSDLISMDKEIAKRILKGEAYNYARQQVFAEYLIKK